VLGGRQSMRSRAVGTSALGRKRVG
jgi:hypothetical protein